MLILTYHEVTARYGLSPADIRTWLEVGLLDPAEGPEVVQVTEPDELPPLVRLHHELGLSAEALDVVAALRRRLLAAHEALAREQARARQLEVFLGIERPS